MSRKLYLALALVLALAGTHAHALGLGGMRLQSALDQPFVGEIDLVDVKPDELDSVKVQIAPQAEFSRTGTERYHHLTKLRFSAQISPRGNPVIRVSSREPMREPYMDFLVEAVWPKGRLVKQYTVLLDPPVTASRSAPRIEQPVVEARPARGAMPGTSAVVAGADSAALSTQAPPPAARPPRIAASPATPMPTPVPNQVPIQVRVPPGAADDFPRDFGPVRPGAGLWRLARANTPAGATVSQTAMALYRNNPHAFVNGDINRLIIGQPLSIPHAGELFALSPEAAQQEFRTALAGGKVRRSPLTDPNTPVGPPGEAGSRLRIAGAPADTAQRGAIPPGTLGTGGQGMEREILLAREASESARQETVEMRGRIRDLEAQLAEIQQLLQLRNAELARVQGGVGSGPGELAPDGAPAAVSAATPVEPRVAEARPIQSPETVPPDLKGAVGVAGGLPPEEGARPSASSLPPAVAGASTPGAGAVQPPPQPPVLPVVATPEPQPDARPVAAVPQSKPQQPSPGVMVVGSAKVPVVEPPSGDSTWRALLLPLAGVAGVTALGIGALTWLRSRRRVGRDSSVEFDSSDLADDLVTRTNRELAAAPAVPRAAVAPAPPLLDSDEIVAVDTPSSAFATFGRADPETDEADAISEADIYIAYGRYREAEDLLREEIRRTPARLDLKFKLAEAYYGAKNTEALHALMQEMRAAGGAQANPDQWQRLVDMAEGTQSEVAQGGVVVPSMRPPSSGVVAAALARAPAPGGGSRLGRDSGVLVESIEPGSADVYTLDISDAQKPSADLALQGLSDDASPPRPAAAPGRVTPISTPISIEAPPQFVEPVLLDDQVFSRELGLEQARGAERRDPGAGGVGDGFLERASDLELNFEDQRPGGDLDLYSVIDSIQLPPPAVETSRNGIEISDLMPPSQYPRTPVAAPRTTSSSGLPGLLGAQEDSASSDLLSSQWQMDSGLWDETATKLDLARAYIEMGDKESARGILQEVGGEGNEEQRAEAQELLRRVD